MPGSSSTKSMRRLNHCEHFDSDMVAAGVKSAGWRNKSGRCLGHCIMLYIFHLRTVMLGWYLVLIVVELSVRQLVLRAPLVVGNFGVDGSDSDRGNEMGLGKLVLGIRSVMGTKCFPMAEVQSIWEVRAWAHLASRYAGSQ